MRTARNDLPLAKKTPDEWAEIALREPLVLLNDHAHLEKKAATNALDLLPRWPDVDPPKRWVQFMTSIARDEVAHLATVSRLLEQRGGTMTRTHRSSYATRLRGLIRMGRAREELVDRLLTSALIELRSCERFEILGRKCPDPILKKLYRSLWASEHGHYSVFVELAAGVKAVKGVAGRWKELLREEAEIISSEPVHCGIHGWVE